MPQFGKGNKAAKKKEGRLCLKQCQRLERELRKKVEEKEADDEEAAAAEAAATAAASSSSAWFSACFSSFSFSF